MGPLIVVHNPAAGRPRGRARRDLLARLASHAFAVIETRTDRGFAQELQLVVARATRDGERPRIAIAGGDGTISLVINALAEPEDATLAIVPLGSGNDLGLSLGIRTVDDGLRALGSGFERTFDCASVGERLFANSIGFGLDALVAVRARELRERNVAFGASYAIAALGSLGTVETFGVMLDADGTRERFASIAMLSVGNGRYYGRGFLGAPQAQLDDGMLDVCVVADPGSVRQRIGLLALIRAGRHLDHPHVTFRRAGRLTIEFDRPPPMHVDGDPFAAERSVFSIATLPRRVRFASIARP